MVVLKYVAGYFSFFRFKQKGESFIYCDRAGSECFCDIQVLALLDLYLNQRIKLACSIRIRNKIVPHPNHS